MALCSAEGLHFLRETYEQDCLGNASFLHVDQWGRRVVGPGAVKALKPSVLLGRKTIYPDFGLCHSEWPFTVFPSGVVGQATIQVVLYVRCSASLALWLLENQFLWGQALLLDTLFLMAGVLTSHKKLKVHLQYVKSWSLYEEVASGTWEKLFWL